MGQAWWKALLKSKCFIIVEYKPNCFVKEVNLLRRGSFLSLSLHLTTSEYVLWNWMRYSSRFSLQSLMIQHGICTAHMFAWWMEINLWRSFHSFDNQAFTLWSMHGADMTTMWLLVTCSPFTKKTRGSKQHKSNSVPNTAACLHWI